MVIAAVSEIQLLCWGPVCETVFLYVDMHTQICMYACMYANIHIYIHTHTIYIYIYIYIYIKEYPKGPSALDSEASTMSGSGGCPVVCRRGVRVLWSLNDPEWGKVWFRV